MIPWLLPHCNGQESGIPARVAVMDFMPASAAEAAAGVPGKVRSFRRPDLRRKISPGLNLADLLRPNALPQLATGVPAVTMNGFQAVMDDLTANPPDTGGAVGPQHVVTMLNSRVQIQTRTGSVIASMTLEKFWDPALPGVMVVDPRILYEPFGKRWVASGIGFSDPDTSVVLLGVSQTADPTGKWNLFNIAIDPGTQYIKGDYDTLGFNTNWVVVSANLFKGVSYTNYYKTNLYVFAKSDLYSGKAPYKIFSDPYGPFIPATDYDNQQSRMILLQEDFGYFSGLIVSEIQGSVGSEVFVQERGYVKPTDYWSNTPVNTYEAGPQLGSKEKLDLGDSRLQNCVFRLGSIWCAQTAFVPPLNPVRAIVQWWQINPAYQILQRGRIEDPTGATFYAYPSIAVNKNGDVLLGYNRFSATQYASANVSFRAAGDAVNTTQPDTVIKMGEAPYSGIPGTGNRWGDFSVTVVDPVDDTNFWTIQEYAASPNAAGTPLWGTWWAQVFPQAAGKSCTWTLSRTTQSFTSTGGTGSVDVATTAACNWMAAANAPWITVTAGGNGNATGAVSYSVARNTRTSDRTGTLTVGGQTVTITQTAAAPAPDLVVTSFTAPTAATLGDAIAVTAALKNQGTAKAGGFRAGFYFGTTPLKSDQDVFSGASCAIDQGLAIGESTACAASITVPSTLKPGTYWLRAVADDLNAVPVPDRSGCWRSSDTGPITLQAPAPALVVTPAFDAAGFVNAASQQSGALAPGEMFDLAGDSLSAAPQTSATYQTLIGGTRVLFDGVAAPLTSVAAKKVRGIVPFGVTPGGVTQVQVESNGVKSAAVAVEVAASAPGIFTGILNQDGTANSVDAPASPLSVVSLLVTGAGQTDPASVDGQVSADGSGALLLPVSATVGGLDARIVAAGPAAGMVGGIVQIQVEIPADAGVDPAAPLAITVGPAGSAPVTVAVGAAVTTN